MRATVVVLLSLLTIRSVGVAQTALPRSSPEAERAFQHYRLGWDAFRSEAWADAARQFQLAIDSDRKFKLAYYGLGRASMALRRFVEAARAYESCRALYEAQAGEKFTAIQDADRMRQDDLDQIQIAINGLSARSQAQQSGQIARNRIQQLRDEARRIQLRRDTANGNISIESRVPAFVSLALGSAYFRSNRLADAEHEYKAAVDDDPNVGEAHNNLAVVYMMTARFDDATREVALAEKTGFTVDADFKQELAQRRKGK